MVVLAGAAALGWPGWGLGELASCDFWGTKGCAADIPLGCCYRLVRFVAMGQNKLEPGYALSNSAWSSITPSPSARTTIWVYTFY